ncbi:uncharacterized protein LOC133909787 [Phragmites australis]|uniref:uncharacterized protein LOC133909787 n=1 Tax=Phragmites australis TaxID=29695 RepID=UPI002D786F7E|nr:uncharacterized protein LOC133909787 [Phragmites australis]
MPRSSSSGSKPILGRAMAILALTLTPISKAKGSLILFKKRASSAARRRCCKPFRHYNYAYVGEYQFSPSRSPLLPCPPPSVTAWRRAAAKKRRSRARMILASLLCGGDELDVAVLDGLPRDDVGAREREALAPAPERGRDEDAFSYGDDVDEEDYPEEEGDEEVDGRAERFIERFYEEMRLQRQRSLVQRLL